MTAPDPIAWLTYWDAALAAARSARRPVLVDVAKDPWLGCAKRDAVTYRDPAVRRAVADRFVPLRLDLFAVRAAVRPLNAVRTPTPLVAARRGTVRYRSLSSLPPADFFDLLDIDEAETRLRWGEHDRAIALLAAVTDRDPGAPFAPEAIFRRGLATYLKTRSAPEMEAIWAELRDRFPDSVWAHRIPWDRWAPRAGPVTPARYHRDGGDGI